MVLPQLLNILNNLTLIKLLSDISDVDAFSEDHLVDEDAEARSEVELTVDDGQCE